MQPPASGSGGICPLCGTPMVAEDVRRTDVGFVCSTCAFKVNYEKMRAQNQVMPGAAGGAVAANDSLLLGLVIGMICGCFGVAWAFLWKTGPQTKKGVLYGFLIGTALGVFLELMRMSHSAPRDPDL